MHKIQRRLFVLSLGAILASPAAACSLVHIPHNLDPSEQGVDLEPPTLAGAKVLQIVRGIGHGATPFSSCDDIGLITIEVDSKDDRTPPDKLGYRVTVIGGVLPDGFAPISGDRRAIGKNKLSLVWVDGASNAQEYFDFTVEIIAIDLAGNESTPSEPLRIASRAYKESEQRESTWSGFSSSDQIDGAGKD